MTRVPRGRASRAGLASFLLASALTFTLAFAATLTACSRGGDVRGTYDVELRVREIGVPIHGTLVLGSRSLEVSDPIWIVRNTRPGGDLSDEDDLLLDANSCLILESPRSPTPVSVMFFESRSRADGLEVPFGFFDNGQERIEVTKLKLFADALSGDLVYTDANGSGEGRLYGDRTGDADGDTCVLALASFVEAIAAEARAETTGDGSR